MIFVSYSHEDDKALKQLQKYLKPLPYWCDAEPGQEASVEIERALTQATTAILLVSSHYLADDEIHQQQLPKLLQRAETGELRLIPVYIDYSNADELELPLTRYRGYGSPQAPLTHANKRAREFQRLVAELLKEQQSAKPTTTNTTVSRHSHRPHTLTVHIQRSGNQLKLDYYLPDRDSIASQSQGWNTIESFLQMSPDQAGYGNQLFELLFGKTSADWEPIFRELFRQPKPQTRPNPIRAPVRLRICSDEPALLNLPWRLMHWQQYRLSDKDWEFCSARELDPSNDYTTSAPCNIVVVAPQAELEVGARDAEHADLVAKTLKQIWPSDDKQQGYLQIVRTRRTLEDALHSMTPHMVYVYAQAGSHDNQDGIYLDDDDGRAKPYSLNRLARWCERLNPAPAVIYLNLTGFDSDHLVFLGTNTPLLIWRRAPKTSPAADRQVLHWLHRWLQQGDDPVSALQQNPERRLFIHSDYRDWKTHVYRAVSRQQLLHLALDRDAQKALVAKHLRELARSETRRVMTIVAYAATGNMLDELSEQLQFHLDLDGADAVEIDRRKLQFPETRQNLPHDLEAELKLQLEQNPDEAIRFLLRRHAPRVTGSGKRAVLWLDWGLFREQDHENWLKPSELEAWLRFTSVYLSRYCPDDIRIVCMLTMELSAKKHQKLAQHFDQYSQRDWCLRQEFWFTVLPPLAAVPYYELFNFLRDHSRCDPDIRAEIARRLHQKTAGEFEPTYQLMRRAEQTTWYDLLTELRHEQGETPDQDEDEF